MRLELSYFELGIDVFLGSPGGKSSVLLDVKPWDDETDMKKLEECVRSVSMPGLFWGACEYHTFSVFMGCFNFFILNLISMSIHMCQDILPFSLHVVCICAAKFVQVVAGIKKLQIMMTIVDDEVSVDNLIEDHLTSEPNNEYIQSCDIVAFNKICKFQLLFLHPISYVTTLHLHLTSSNIVLEKESSSQSSVAEFSGVQPVYTTQNGFCSTGSCQSYRYPY
jgi:translation elongation factor EF-1beta